MERDRNPTGYAQARIDELNNESRKTAAKTNPLSRRRAGDQRIPGRSDTARPDQTVAAVERDPAAPSR